MRNVTCSMCSEVGYASEIAGYFGAADLALVEDLVRLGRALLGGDVCGTA